MATPWSGGREVQDITLDGIEGASRPLAVYEVGATVALRIDKRCDNLNCPACGDPWPPRKDVK